MITQTPSLILASSSRYRKELLERLQLPFICIAPDLDESALPDEIPLALSQRLALAKANAIAITHPSSVVIGSDQVADLNGQALGKSVTHERAVAQLRMMRGQTLLFHTSVAVVCLATNVAEQSTSTVRVVFRNYSNSEIDNYLRIEPAYDCAGSAKSEGLGIALMESMHSDDPTALVGLPLIATARMLRAAGLPLLG